MAKYWKLRESYPGEVFDAAIMQSDNGCGDLLRVDALNIQDGGIKKKYFRPQGMEKFESVLLRARVRAQQLQRFKLKPEFKKRLLGSSRDGRTNSWHLQCSQCGGVWGPPTTMLARALETCSKCGAEAVVDYNDGKDKEF